LVCDVMCLAMFANEAVQYWDYLILAETTMTISRGGFMGNT
jgi:hypothetical protein